MKVNDKRYVYEQPKMNIEHVKRKAEEYYWEADNLQEEMQVGEFTIRVDEDDDTMMKKEVQLTVLQVMIAVMMGYKLWPYYTSFSIICINLSDYIMILFQ